MQAEEPAKRNRAGHLMEQKPTAKEQALGWFTRLNSDNADKEDHRAFVSWLSQSPENRAEYAALENIWLDLGHVKDPRSNVVSLPQQSHGRQFSRRQFFMGGTLAASLAGVAVINGWHRYLLSDYHTAAGEIKEVKLEDGSRVVLDADSALAASFSRKERRVSLQKGRAFFEVAKDRERPFLVDMSEGEVRALGTQFTVHQWADRVTVSVAESAVGIVAPNSSRMKIAAGQSVSYHADGFDEIRPFSLSTGLAWQSGKLVFEDRPFRQVVDDLNRYRTGRIFVTDTSLLDLRVSGVFDLSDPEKILKNIVKTLPVRLVEATDYLAFLLPA